MSALPLKLSQVLEYLSNLIDTKLREIDDDRLWFEKNERNLTSIRQHDQPRTNSKLYQAQQQENIKMNEQKMLKEKIKSNLELKKTQTAPRSEAFNPKKGIKINLPIKLNEKLDRSLDLLMQGFSNNFLSLLSSEKVLLNQCSVMALPDFAITPPINLHYLNYTKSSNPISRNHISNNHIQYMNFLRRCYQQPKSNLCVEGSLVVGKQKLFIVKYLTNFSHGFFLRKDDVYDVLPQFPKFLSDCDLMEDLLLGLELDDELDQLREHIKINGRIIVPPEKPTKNGLQES